MSNEDQNPKQPYLLTVHVNGEEETMTFPTLESRDDFVKKMKQDESVNVGPMISDDKWSAYNKKRNTVLDDGGVHIDFYEENGVQKVKYSFSEEANAKIEKEAMEQGISVDALIEQALQQSMPSGTVSSDQAPMSRQQRRLLERRARKKTKTK